jgi:mannose-1-phosphate guanylyltransferase
MTVAGKGFPRVRCMIFGAGLGSRLGPMTQILPKPLVPIGAQPVLLHIAARLSEVALGEIVVNTFHAAGAYEGLGDPRFTYVREAVLLGTAGGVKHAGEVLGPGPVLLCNGDILTEFAPATLLAAAEASAALATLVALPLPAGEGNLGVAEDGRLVRLRQARLVPEVAEHRGGAFLGMHLISDALRRLLPRAGCLVGDTYIPLLRAGARIEVVWSSRPFSDIGTIDAYVAANWSWLERRSCDVFVDPTAHVSGRTVRSIVGARAQIHGSVENAIVWPGTTIAGDIRNCIVSNQFHLPICTPIW